jgi:hypothetical protein
MSTPSLPWVELLKNTNVKRVLVVVVVGGGAAGLLRWLKSRSGKKSVVPAGKGGAVVGSRGRERVNIDLQFFQVLFFCVSPAASDLMACTAVAQDYHHHRARSAQPRVLLRRGAVR